MQPDHITDENKAEVTLSLVGITRM